MRIPKPFLPVAVETDGLSYKARVLGREMTFGANSLVKSIKSKGKELLSEQMRFVGTEDGEPIIWDNDSENNESGCFVQSRKNDKVVLCGAMMSKAFIINTAVEISYDGCVCVDASVMPRGLTVAQVFGMADTKPMQYKLDKLWLEIPLNADIGEFYNIYPIDDLHLEDGRVIERSETMSSGRIPLCGFHMPHKPLLWLGGDDCGFGFFCESDKNCQPSDSGRLIEVLPDKNGWVLRIRLLDSPPKVWGDNYTEGYGVFEPLTYKFGFMATPVKEFPENPYLEKMFHPDCFVKVKGNYIDFLRDKNRFDRLVEKGVTTLVLHEKWNKAQNSPELSEFTAKQLREIVDECHKRGIKVLTYFGYEVSTILADWGKIGEKSEIKNEKGEHFFGGWYRVPFQRDYSVCYNSEYSDFFVDGIVKIVDEFNIDGIYLDSTSMPKLCANTAHGCGYYDEDGELHGTYQILAIRDMFRRIYCEMSARGCVINLHSFGCLNFTALPYVNGTWYGENLQAAYIKGSDKDMPLDYFRAEYTGRNMGVPVEFIAYENRPVWNFENAAAMSLIHGILPRPNDIEHPLDLMSEIWRVIDSFPVSKSEWCPYWKGDERLSDARAKCSYYKYTTPDGDRMYLAFVSNTTAAELYGLKLNIGETEAKVTDMLTGEDTDAFDLAPFGYKILYIKNIRYRRKNKEKRIEKDKD